MVFFRFVYHWFALSSFSLFSFHDPLTHSCFICSSYCSLSCSYSISSSLCYVSCYSCHFSSCCYSINFFLIVFFYLFFLLFNLFFKNCLNVNVMLFFFLCCPSDSFSFKTFLAFKSEEFYPKLSKSVYKQVYLFY